MHLLITSVHTLLEIDLLESEPLSAVLSFSSLLNELGSLLDDLADWRFLLSILLCSGWVFLDRLVSGFVVVLEGLAFELFLPTSELFLEALRLTFDEIVVLLDVDSEDVLTMLISSEDSLSLGGGSILLLLLASIFFNLLHAVSWESLHIVRDVETAVTSSLHGSEDTISGSCANETDIEVCLEWPSLANMVLNGVEGSIDLVVSLVHILHLLESQ